MSIQDLPLNKWICVQFHLFISKKFRLLKVLKIQPQCILCDYVNCFSSNRNELLEGDAIRNTDFTVINDVDWFELNKDEIQFLIGLGVQDFQEDNQTVKNCDCPMNLLLIRGCQCGGK